MKYSDYKQYFSPVLAKTTDLVATTGSGCHLKDFAGNEYIDFVQGIAVNALGHCHPSVVKAITDQTSKLITASFNLVNYPSTLEFAKRLATLTPAPLNTIFFSNSGAEANDGAIKLARAYSKRTGVVAFRGSFHGRTMGASSITGSNAKYRKYIEPAMGGVYFVPYPTKKQCPVGYDEDNRTDYCLNEIKNLFRYIVCPDTVASIIVEPVLGEGGYVVPQKRFLQGLRNICDEHDILLIFDEIQCGYGRTGKMFAAQYFDVTPDIMTLGKAIAGGFPMSAIISSSKVMNEWKPGMHGTTFGGHPIGASAALAVLDEFEKVNILDNVVAMGSYLEKCLRKLQAKYPIISDVRGVGLMQAIEFTHADGRPGGDIYSEVRQYTQKHGLLLLGCGLDGDGIRFASPLNVTKAVIDDALKILENALKSTMHLF